MFDLDRWEEIWATLTRNKWRSFMTAMGVFWAIFMLVIMSGAGVGLERMLIGNTSFATNSCFFISNRTSEEYKGLPKGRKWQMKYDDIENMRTNIDGIEYISRYALSKWGLKAVRNSKSIRIGLNGIEPVDRYINYADMVYGRYVNDIDITQVRMVCTIGTETYENLFPEGDDPSGEMIKIGHNVFTVIGVHKSPNPQMSIFGPLSSKVYIPLTTMQKIYNTGDNIESFAISAKDGYDVTEIETKIGSKLRQLYMIAPNDTKAIWHFNVAEEFKVFTNLFLGLNILIWIVGIGTLFAGVIGVSNIMLIVVKERTQEIGVRRALGATPTDIIVQIMSESFVLTFITGVIALGASVGVLSLAEMIFNSNPSPNQPAFSPQITFNFAILSAGIMIISGLLAGIIPAIRAIKVKAVDAIREE